MFEFDSTQLFGLKTPIIQAPMAGISTPELAAAVANAGGLGSIAIGASSLPEALSAIQKTRALTSMPFNVNVFCHEPPKRDLERENKWLDHLRPLFEELGEKPPSGLNEIYRSFMVDDQMFEMLLNQRPAFVSFHFGIPSSDKIRALQRLGIKTLATATNLKEAALITKAGIDGVIAQGIEAGGHRGHFEMNETDENLNTADLIRTLKKTTKIPIIAAGGIMNGKDIRHALSLGASGVQLGTAFLLCPESAANEAFRSLIRDAKEDSTKMTPVISGRPARGLKNRLMEFGEKLGAPAPAAYPLAYDAAKQLNAIAAKDGIFEFSAFWAGEGVSKARELPARQLIAKLLDETKEMSIES